jgi:hypothetical protein
MKVYGDMTEMSGHLHTSVILPSGKEHQIPLAWGLSGPSILCESSGEKISRDHTPVVHFLPSQSLLVVTFHVYEDQNKLQGNGCRIDSGVTYIFHPMIPRF